MQDIINMLKDFFDKLLAFFKSLQPRTDFGTDKDGNILE